MVGRFLDHTNDPVIWRIVDDNPGRCSKTDQIYAGNRNRLIAVLSNKAL